MEYKYLSSLQKKATPYCSPRIPTSRGCPLPLPKLNLKPAGKVAAGVRGAPPGVQNEGGEMGGEHIPLSRNHVPFQIKKRGHLEANQLSRSHEATRLDEEAGVHISHAEAVLVLRPLTDTTWREDPTASQPPVKGGEVRPRCKPITSLTNFFTW